MLDGKCFKPLFRFCTVTDDALHRDDCAIALTDKARAKLCQQLGDDFYTYMVLSDSLCHEVISVCYSEGILFIERGLDDTDARSWPCGTSLSFEATLSAWMDSRKLVEIEPEECEEELFSGKIKNGNCTVHFKDGVAVKEKVNKKQIPDGCYTHPIPTYKNGCLVEIAEGAGYPTLNNCCK